MLKTVLLQIITILLLLLLLRHLNDLNIPNHIKHPECSKRKQHKIPIKTETDLNGEKVCVSLCREPVALCHVFFNFLTLLLLGMI